MILLLPLLLILLLILLSLSYYYFCYSFAFIIFLFFVIFFAFIFLLLSLPFFWYVKPIRPEGSAFESFLTLGCYVASRRSKLAVKLVSITPQYNPVLSA